MPESKYYDKYIGTISIACNGEACLSHGLSETRTWYNDVNRMLDEEYTWMIRSGFFSDVTTAGIFSFSSSTVSLGTSNNTISFRLVMNNLN